MPKKCTRGGVGWGGSCRGGVGWVMQGWVDSSNYHALGHSVQKSLRICLDPRDLNKALEREPYYTCSIEEIPGKFHGMKRFTIADFNKGYWMVESHPESRKLTIVALLKMFSRGNWMASS